MRMRKVIYLALGLGILQSVCEGADYSMSYQSMLIDEYLKKPPVMGCEGEATDPKYADESLGDASDCGNVITLLAVML